jgi:tetratricopeptide (TPR) repeat protein
VLLLLPGFIAGIGLAVLVLSPDSPAKPARPPAEDPVLAEDPDMRSGEEAFKAGKPKEAITAFESARKRHPQRPEPLLGLARVFIACKYTESALQACRMARDLAPDNAACHLVSGQAFELAGERDRARESYARAARLDPGDPNRPLPGQPAHGCR